MLLERIKAHSESLGDRPALTAGEEVVRWGELWPMAYGLAAKLRAEGTGPVALVGDPGEVWVPGGLCGLPAGGAALSAPGPSAAPGGTAGTAGAGGCGSAGPAEGGGGLFLRIVLPAPR